MYPVALFSTERRETKFSKEKHGSKQSTSYLLEKQNIHRKNSFAERSKILVGHRKVILLNYKIIM